MRSRLYNLITRLAEVFTENRPLPVTVPVSCRDGLSPQVQRALARLEERHDRKEISDAAYVRQLERLTGC